MVTSTMQGNNRKPSKPQSGEAAGGGGGGIYTLRFIFGKVSIKGIYKRFTLSVKNGIQNGKGDNFKVSLSLIFLFPLPHSQLVTVPSSSRPMNIMTAV